MNALLTALAAWPPAGAAAALTIGPALRRRDCDCGHHRQAHQHYRAGTDCSLCDCSSFHAGRQPVGAR